MEKIYISPTSGTRASAGSFLPLVNPTDSALSGTLELLLDDGSTDSTVSYTLAPRSASTLNLSNQEPSIRIGQARISPTAGSATPDGVLVFSYAQDGITVSETSVAAVESHVAFRTYAEATAAIQTGIAFANAGESPTTLTLSLTDLSGEDLGIRATVSIPANGHRAVFLREIQGFADLPPDFRGVLRIVSDGASSVSIAALRGRYNERNDFIVSTFPVIEDGAPTPAPLIFPQVADGGGYTTEFILFSSSSAAASGAVILRDQFGNPLLVEFQ